MAKHGERGLGYEIVQAVIRGEIAEPITVNKVKQYCKRNGINASENHMRVILSNASDNTHSPTYKKYFERVGRGEYVVLPEYKNQTRYFWLNVNAIGYNWTFADIKVGKSQTYFSHNENGTKRKNEKCFRDIKVGDYAVAYMTGDTKEITTLCRVIDKQGDDGEYEVKFQKIRDYESGLEWQHLKCLKELKNCEAVHFHRGTLFEIEKRHYDIIVQMLEQLNQMIDTEEELYQAVKASMEDGKRKRESRLESRRSVYPDAYEVTTRAYLRNADVIAEVQIRANGICEKCGNEAPFKRASDGTPYLEVHHIIRLADGGEDTVENTIAVCPNCHRQLHFG